MSFTHRDKDTDTHTHTTTHLLAAGVLEATPAFTLAVFPVAAFAGTPLPTVFLGVFVLTGFFLDDDGLAGAI